MSQNRAPLLEIVLLFKIDPLVRWKGGQTLVGRVGWEITIDTIQTDEPGQGRAQREIPLLCFVLILQWEPRFGQVGLITTGSTNRIGRGGRRGMIYEAIIGEIAKLVPEQSFIRQLSHMSVPLHAFVREKTFS